MDLRTSVVLHSFNLLLTTKRLTTLDYYKDAPWNWFCTVKSLRISTVHVVPILILNWSTGSPIDRKILFSSCSSSSSSSSSSRPYIFLELLQMLHLKTLREIIEWRSFLCSSANLFCCIFTPATFNVKIRETSTASNIFKF